MLRYLIDFNLMILSQTGGKNEAQNSRLSGKGWNEYEVGDNI